MGRRRGSVRARGGPIIKVGPTASFIRDVEGQIAWLERNRTPNHVARLRQELSAALALLQAAPEIGTLAGDVRCLLLKSLPFVIWYRCEGPSVFMLRLFHARQSR